MNMQNHFTTPRQSEALLKIGIPANSADCYYYDWAWTDWMLLDGGRIQVCTGFTLAAEKTVNMNSIHPCWSAGRLIEIYEFCIGDSYSRHTNNSVIDDLISDFYIHIQEMDLKKLEDILC